VSGDVTRPDGTRPEETRPEGKLGDVLAQACAVLEGLEAQLGLPDYDWLASGLADARREGTRWALWEIPEWHPPFRRPEGPAVCTMAELNAAMFYELVEDRRVDGWKVAYVGAFLDAYETAWRGKGGDEEVLRGLRDAGPATAADGADDGNASAAVAWLMARLTPGARVALRELGGHVGRDWAVAGREDARIEGRLWAETGWPAPAPEAASVLKTAADCADHFYTLVEDDRLQQLTADYVETFFAAWEARRRELEAG